MTNENISRALETNKVCEPTYIEYFNKGKEPKNFDGQIQPAKAYEPVHMYVYGAA